MPGWRVQGTYMDGHSRGSTMTEGRAPPAGAEFALAVLRSATEALSDTAVLWLLRLLSALWASSCSRAAAVLVPLGVRPCTASAEAGVSLPAGQLKTAWLSQSQSRSGCWKHVCGWTHVGYLRGTAGGSGGSLALPEQEQGPLRSGGSQSWMGCQACPLLSCSRVLAAKADEHCRLALQSCCTPPLQRRWCKRLHWQHDYVQKQLAVHL